MTDEQIRQKIIEHDLKFDTFTKSVSELSKDIKQMTKILSSINLINERIHNMDDNLKESFARVHNRIDEQKKRIDEINKLGCMKNKDNVISLIDSRKWIIMVVIGSVLASILGLVVGNYKGSLESENKSLKSQIRHLKKENR